MKGGGQADSSTVREPSRGDERSESSTFWLQRSDIWRVAFGVPDEGHMGFHLTPSPSAEPTRTNQDGGNIRPLRCSQS